MNVIKIKPISVNVVWQGKRFKTKAYKEYEQELFYLLPKIKIPKGKLQLNLEFGCSNKASDIDNFCKPFIDILQKKYLFNDRMIYQLNIIKVIVKKGNEYIKFKLEEYVK